MSTTEKKEKTVDRSLTVSKPPQGVALTLPEDMLLVTSSPHARTGWSQAKIMWAVVVALIPNAIAAAVIFGWRAPALMLTAMVSCMAAEWAWQAAMKKKITIRDGSAALTGLLLAMTLGTQVSFYAIIVGSMIAIIVAKQFFGGLGMNIWNPALVGRAFMQVAFPQMLNGGFPMPEHGVAGDGTLLESLRTAAAAKLPAGIDAISTATPLMVPKDPNLLASVQPVWVKWGEVIKDLFLGAQPGSMGEASVLALLLGGLVLLALRLIDWRVPFFFIATTLILIGILPYGSEMQVSPSLAERIPDVIYLAFSGGLFLGAVYMATDMVTSPITKKGRIIFAVGAGALTALIRLYGGYPEGVCYSILIMNTTVPLIDRFVRPKVYGTKRGPEEAGLPV